MHHYHENPLHFDMVDRYLPRMGDKTIPDNAPDAKSGIVCYVHSGVWDRRQVSEVTDPSLGM